MKEKFGTLDFEVKFRRPNELQNIGLPVEVRRPDLSLVKTGLTSEPMELEPGKYFVISKMPAGQEIFDQIEIKADRQKTAVLKLEKDEESPHESEAVQHFFIANRQKVLFALEGFEDVVEKVHDVDLPVVQLRVFKGNLLSEKIRQTRANWETAVSEKGLLGFKIRGVPEAQIAQLLQTGAPPLNMVLPAMSGYSCRLFVTSLVEGKYTLDAHLENQAADMLLRYSNKGYSQQTELLGQTLDAKELLRSKAQDPIAAAVGAYALLRFNQIEMLHDWTENLRNWFEWLPDSSAVRGEHLALLGRHEEALKAFLEIEERGLPIFSNGLSYTIDRLSTYLDVKPDFVDSSTVKKTKSLLGKLQKFAAYADFREPFTTFTGLNINEPSAEPVKKIAKDDKALDLTNLIP